MIPYGRQEINQDDIAAVTEVLKSDFLTQGPAVSRFESRVTEVSQAKYAVAVNSATSALHIACLAIGVTKGDYVWTSPITFVASANCALYCGASVDFVDIDSQTYNISPAKLREKLEEARQQKTLPKVLIAVHLAGHSCEMQNLHTLAAEFGFKIIEDASHAIGGKYQGRPIGACAFSDITVFSFHPVKIVTTGEGGMAVTNDSNLHKRMISLRSHGITKTPSEMTRVPDGEWYYEQQDLGFNYRITDIQAALGVSQLGRISAFIERRREIKKTYDRLLSALPLQLPTEREDCYSAWHLYIIRIKNQAAKETRDSLFKYLRKNGILVNLHYIPIYRQPYYGQFAFAPSAFPEAERYYEEALSIPMFPGLDDQQILHIAQHVTIGLNSELGALK